MKNTIHNHIVPFLWIITVLLFLYSTYSIIAFPTHQNTRILEQDLRHWETSPDIDITTGGAYELCHAGILYYVVRTERDSYSLISALTNTGDIVTCIEK